MVRLSAKASVTHAADGAHSSQLALALPVGDVKLKATLKDVTLTKEPRYRKGLLLGVEKPGDFSIDYNVEDGVSAAEGILVRRAINAGRDTTCSCGQHCYGDN